MVFGFCVSVSIFTQCQRNFHYWSVCVRANPPVLDWYFKPLRYVQPLHTRAAFRPVDGWSCVCVFVCSLSISLTHTQPTSTHTLAIDTAVRAWILLCCIQLIVENSIKKLSAKVLSARYWIKLIILFWNKQLVGGAKFSLRR